MGEFPIRLRNWLVLFMGSLLTHLAAQPQITGHIALDTTRWAPVAYLSVIPDFTQMYSISNEFIIQKTSVNAEGTFTFNTGALGKEDRLYRLHFSKRGDPPASLIIGGADENHLFLVANSHSIVKMDISGGAKLLNQVFLAGYLPNQALLEINQIAAFLDTLDYYGPAVNREFVRQAVYDRLRNYADTCSDPLVSLYALYHSRFEYNLSDNHDFYRKYLHKWRNEDSEYFRVFRNQVGESVPAKPPYLLIIAVVLILAGSSIFLMFRYRKRPVKTAFQSLTVQERKIFSLLKEGKSNKEISDACAISLSTVKSHVNNIYSKLNMNSRTDVMDFNG